MDQALIQIGLPIKCAYGDCDIKGFVKPHSDYAGWYKSKMFRKLYHQRWFCPGHYQMGREMDNKFYENYKTPDPEPDVTDTVDELYKLLDEEN